MGKEATETTDHVSRLDDRPIDVTLDDGQIVTIGAERQKGRLKIKVTTPGKGKVKRRPARSDTASDLT